MLDNAFTLIDEYIGADHSATFIFACKTAADDTLRMGDNSKTEPAMLNNDFGILVWPSSGS